MSVPPPPLIAYIRVSRRGDREDGRFHSPKEQEERGRSFGTAQGYAVGQAIQDIDVSGATHPQERKGMAVALEEIRAGRAGGMVAYSLDRFSREPAHGDWLVREVTSHGGILLAPDMPDALDTPTGEFTFGMLLNVARLYRRTAADRLGAAKDRATRSGIPVTTVPLGYTQDSERRMVVNPKTAPIVVELFEMRAKRASWQDLSDHLDARTERVWSRAAVRHIIRSVIYRTGKLVHAGVVSDWDSGTIVDDDLWYAAQLPPAVAASAVRGSQGKWLGTGLFRCASCGKSMAPWRPAKSHSSARRYRCTHRSCPARASAAGERIEDMAVEAAFRLDIKLMSKEPEDIDLTPLEEALASAEVRLAQVLTPEAQDALQDDWPTTAKARRLARDEAARLLGEARVEARAQGRGGKLYRLSHIWEDLTPEAQREALRWAFEEVKVRKVGRGEPPSLEYVQRAIRPYNAAIPYNPPEVEIVGDGWRPPETDSSADAA